MKNDVIFVILCIFVINLKYNLMRLMTKEDKITAKYVLVAWAVLLVCVCIWPDFFTQQLFESTTAMWVSIGAMAVISFFMPAFVRRLRGK